MDRVDPKMLKKWAMGNRRPVENDNSVGIPKLTSTNLHVLKREFATSDSISNRLAPTSFPHLKRCMDAGLVRQEGSQLILTAEGKKELGR